MFYKIYLHHKKYVYVRTLHMPSMGTKTYQDTHSQREQSLIVGCSSMSPVHNCVYAPSVCMSCCSCVYYRHKWYRRVNNRSIKPIFRLFGCLESSAPVSGREDGKEDGLCGRYTLCLSCVFLLSSQNRTHGDGVFVGFTLDYILKFSTCGLLAFWGERGVGDLRYVKPYISTQTPEED